MTSDSSDWRGDLAAIVQGCSCPVVYEFNSPIVPEKRSSVREHFWSDTNSPNVAEVTRKALSIVRFILSNVWHVRCNIYQSGNGWICARLRDYSSPIAVCDKDARSVLLRQDAFHGGHVILEGCLRLLDDADFEAASDKPVVNASPARPVRPGTVDENDVFHVELLRLQLWCT